VKACVFVGPTLRAEDLPPESEIVVLPPVAQGDVYRVAQARPRAIGIVDGYFEGVLSVWHKEILWAMAEGIHVFGSASMGALRAAELHPFGMRGTGRIFEAYRDGELEDDDEVAVIHGPPETCYLALSEAMVNIRATRAAAKRNGIIAAATRDALVRSAKELFYHDRTSSACSSVPPRGQCPLGSSQRCAPGCRRVGSTKSARTRSPCSRRCGSCWLASPSRCRSTTPWSGPRCGTTPARRQRRPGRLMPMRNAIGSSSAAHTASLRNSC
jgi:hypothetical protein